VPRLTSIRELPRDRVALELDGHPWRVVPTNAVARAGLAPGMELSRERARGFRRELRRAEALELATRALGRRDAARAELDARLERRGVVEAVRDEALDRLEELGAVDDDRFAAARVGQLVARGYGDAAILADLEQRGVDPSRAAAALSGTPPERERADELLTRLGPGPKTAAYLARRGFCEEVVLEAAGEPW
jgi:regulatory protein